MVGHGGSSAGSYLTDPTSLIPSHCASIVVTSTVRVKNTLSSLLHIEWRVLYIYFDQSHFSSELNYVFTTLTGHSRKKSQAADHYICTARWHSVTILSINSIWLAHMLFECGVRCMSQLSGATSMMHVCLYTPTDILVGKPNGYLQSPHWLPLGIMSNLVICKLWAE